MYKTPSDKKKKTSSPQRAQIKQNETTDVFRVSMINQRRPMRMRVLERDAFDVIISTASDVGPV